MIKYVVIPEVVISKNDGDIHYITAEQLIKLYNVDRNECIVLSNRERGRGFANTKKLIVLTPDPSGNYDKPS